ncbi:RNA polymerase II subunit B1 CTD phosphatase RPAP2-like protein [Rhynchospora pubera]|uniref:RNA polymerase II subunit B1 CTD phosphatase RPAP2 homolog n=1 Tax=Rhynchospora pubera TaxID=906938 RepID=A0AAV8FFN6_9POAL|nr:RNA polymerase II subunit B1 CTD phosphatase RPAP2-like protein [Rhynchospora pubera]
MAPEFDPPSSIATAVYQVQMILLEQGASSERQLEAAASLLSQSDYSDVVTERAISDLCGYPLCARALAPSPSPSSTQPHYHISLSEHRVYDLLQHQKDAANFCSRACLIASRAFQATLSEQRPPNFHLTSAALQHIIHLFQLQDGGGPNKDASASASASPPPDSDFHIKVKDSNSIDPHVAIQDSIGPHDAIEGYVPKSNSNSNSHRHSSQALKPPPEEDIMDFTSDIIFGDASHDLSSSQTKLISDDISNKLHSIALGGDKLDKNKPKGKNSLSSKVSKAKPNKKLPSSEQRNSESGSGGENLQQNNSKLKSSLKKEGSSLGQRTQSQSVRWADEERGYAKESSEKSDVLSEEEAVRSLRLASAEACAAALSHAADIVSSSNSEVEDAVLEAGIVILPQLHNGTERDSEEKEVDTEEIERGVVKWPQKPVLLETDMFEVDDSWHDTPPEGFNLDLSPFGTIWMAIFGWVTRSTVCFTYGHDESLSEEFSEVEGREYPRKVVLNDGQSAEIRKALDGFVDRALPSLVLDLRLPVPVSTLEKYLGRLMDTMTLVEALPALRTRQWHVVVLLFLDALSVHHLPLLSSITSNRSLLLLKVLNGAQIDAAQYNSMMEILLPLGRSTPTRLSFESTR